MTLQIKRKIVLIGDSLSGGGAERVQARLSFFFESKGIEVHHIIVTDKVDYPYAGKLFNMGTFKSKSNGFLNKLKRLRLLKNYLEEHRFDFIIDFRFRNHFLQEFILHRWIYAVPYVASIRSYSDYGYFPKSLFLSKQLYRDAYGLVTVSKALEAKIRDKYLYSKVQTIYNPFDFDVFVNEVPKEQEYIIAVGRMNSNVKQFDKLMEAYTRSVLPTKGIELHIYGDGRFKEELENYRVKLRYSSLIHLKGRTDVVLSKMKNAQFTVLCSAFEGFPNVLLESLSVGTPVVSFDCLSGPSEIIHHRENGLLVPDQNFEALTLAMNELTQNRELYIKCKQNAAHSVAEFSLEKIGNQWLDFLKIK